MPSAETEVYRDSFVNWVRFNHRDLFNVTVWVGLFLGVAAVCWLILHAVLLVHPPPAPHVCTTVAQCNAQILAHPLHVKPAPGFPVFKPPTLTPTT